MRGFVTLAVGNEKYYKMAVNLLNSYKYNTKESMPFAIIADKRNKYTDLFDKIILIEEPNCSYMDKLEMLNNPPFEENIFIDADSLVYGDINRYWDYFPEKGTTCFGKALPLISHDGWFEVNDIGEYKDKINFIPQMHGGVIFFKNDDLTKKIFETALIIKNNYAKYRFKYFSNPADEPILALSMAINNTKPIELAERENERAILFYPTALRTSMDIVSGKLSYLKRNGERYDNVLLLHWQNINTETPKYKIEVAKLNMSLQYIPLLTVWFYISYYSKKTLLRIYNGIKRRIKRMVFFQ